MQKSCTNANAHSYIQLTFPVRPRITRSEIKDLLYNKAIHSDTNP